MADGQTLKEIRSILASDDKLPQNTVNRLMLSIMAELYEKKADAESVTQLTANLAAFVEMNKQLKNDVEKLKEQSIVRWVMDNKAIATFIVVLVMVIMLAGEPTINVLALTLAKAVGVPYP